MFVVMGATGHVGGAAVEALLERGAAVTAVVRDERKGEALRARGAAIAVADALDPEQLRAAFRQGRRAFLLNPPAPTTGDTDSEERRSVAAILEALEGSGLEKVVAQSVYTARPGKGIGDLGVLYELEAGLMAQPIPVTVQRGTYFMSNWDAALETARSEGVVHSLFPADFRLPMVAPKDLGRAAARFLAEPAERTGLRHVEGPERYTPADVAAFFAEALGRPVKVVVTPKAQWQAAFLALGFSEAAAASYAGMTALALESPAPDPAEVERGSITLREYIRELVERGGRGGA